MARSKACFSASVTRSDRFTNMSAEARALYHDLAYEADNDGSFTGAIRLVKGNGFKPEALEELIENGFIFHVGEIYVIADWFINNNQDRLNYSPGPNIETIVKHFEPRQVNGAESRKYRLRETPLDREQAEYSLNSDPNIKEWKRNKEKRNKRRGLDSVSKGIEENQIEENKKEENISELGEGILDGGNEGAATGESRELCPHCGGDNIVKKDKEFFCNECACIFDKPEIGP